MGLRDKVTFLLVTVIFIQITITCCMPRYFDNVKETNSDVSKLHLTGRGSKLNKPLFTNVKNTNERNNNAKHSQSMYKTFNFPEIEYPLDTTPKNHFSFVKNLETHPFEDVVTSQSKAIKDLKKEMRIKRKLNRNNEYENQQKTGEVPVSSIILPSGSGWLKEQETFPEVYYPANALETWQHASKYWNPSLFTKNQNTEFSVFDPNASEKSTIFYNPYKKQQLKSKVQHFMEEIEKFKKMQKQNSKSTIASINNSGTTSGNLTDYDLNPSNKTLTAIENFIHKSESLVNMSTSKTNHREQIIPEMISETSSFSNNVTEEINRIVKENNNTSKSEAVNNTESIIYSKQIEDIFSGIENPLNIEIPIPLVDTIGDTVKQLRFERNPYLPVIVMPVSSEELQLPYYDIGKNSQIIVLLPSPNDNIKSTMSLPNAPPIVNASESVNLLTGINSDIPNSQAPSLFNNESNKQLHLCESIPEIPIINISKNDHEVLPNNSECYVSTLQEDMYIRDNVSCERNKNGLIAQVNDSTLLHTGIEISLTSEEIKHVSSKTKLLDRPMSPVSDMNIIEDTGIRDIISCDSEILQSEDNDGIYTVFINDEASDIIPNDKGNPTRQELIITAIDIEQSTDGDKDAPNLDAVNGPIQFKMFDNQENFMNNEQHKDNMKKSNGLQLIDGLRIGHEEVIDISKCIEMEPKFVEPRDISLNEDLIDSTVQVDNMVPSDLEQEIITDNFYNKMVEDISQLLLDKVHSEGLVLVQSFDQLHITEDQPTRNVRQDLCPHSDANDITEDNKLIDNVISIEELSEEPDIENTIFVTETPVINQVLPVDIDIELTELPFPINENIKDMRFDNVSTDMFDNEEAVPVGIHSQEFLIDIVDSSQNNSWNQSREEGLLDKVTEDTSPTDVVMLETVSLDDPTHSVEMDLSSAEMDSFIKYIYASL